MATKKEIAMNYLEFLENGNIRELLKLFSEDGIVDSPVYGLMTAKQFYHELTDNTQKSKLILKGVFEEKNSGKIAIYFHYNWTLINNEQVEFDVVDIIEFNSSKQITKLKIIYDTVKSRKVVNELKDQP